VPIADPCGGDHHRGVSHGEAASLRIDGGPDARQQLVELARRKLAVASASFVDPVRIHIPALFFHCVSSEE
jgi:hypothetical protein